MSNKKSIIFQQGSDYMSHSSDPLDYDSDYDSDSDYDYDSDYDNEIDGETKAEKYSIHKRFEEYQAIIEKIDPKYREAFSAKFDPKMHHYNKKFSQKLTREKLDYAISVLFFVAFDQLKTMISTPPRYITSYVTEGNLLSTYETVFQFENIKNKKEILDQLAAMEIAYKKNFNNLPSILNIKHHVKILGYIKKYVRDKKERLELEKSLLTKILTLAIIRTNKNSLEVLYELRNSLETPPAEVLALFLRIIHQNESEFDLTKENPVDLEWLGEFFGKFQNIIDNPTVQENLPLPDVLRDICLDYYDEAHCDLKEELKKLMLSKINIQGKTLIEHIYDSGYGSPSYRETHPFQEIVKNINLLTVIDKNAKSNNVKFKKYLDDAKKQKEVSALAKTLNSLSVIRRDHNEYKTLLEKCINQAGLKEVKLNEHLLATYFDSLIKDSKEEDKLQISPREVFIVLFKSFNKQQAYEFLEKLTIEKLKPQVLVDLLKAFKALNPLIRVDLMKRFFESIPSTMISNKFKSANLSATEINDLLSLYEHDKKSLIDKKRQPIIQELDEYILKTNNPLRAVQACKAKWMLAYSPSDQKDSKEQKTDFNPRLVKLIESVQKDHDHNRRRYSFLGTASNLVTILVRAKETINPSPPQAETGTFARLFKTKNDKAYELINASKKRRKTS